VNRQCAENDYATGRQIFVILRPRMAFTHIKRQSSMSSFNPPALAFGMLYCCLVNCAFPSPPYDLISLLLLSLGLSLGVTAIPFATEFLAYLAASSSVFGGVFGGVAWLFSWAGLDESTSPALRF
jgi:xanthosine utilization system XapX-like protein